MYQRKTPGTIAPQVQDWDMVKRRWSAFWANDMIDRPIIKTAYWHEPDKAMLAEANYTPKWESDPQKEWLDAKQIVSRHMHNAAHIELGGESIHAMDNRWSVAHALLFGCKPQLNSFASWCDPLPEGPDGYPVIKYEHNDMWHWMMETTAEAARLSRGRFYVRPDWGNFTGDILSTIRGDMNLMYDIGENKEWVKKAIDTVTDGLMDMYADLFDRIESTGLEGNVNYLACWSPGRTMCLDCDICCMISPDDFKNLFVEGIERAIGSVDHTIFHLDGPDAIKHLDTLLAIPELNAIQWMPGATKMPIMQWVPLLQRIQAGGKALLVCAEPEEVPLLLKEISPKGLAISTYARSKEHMDKFMEDVYKWF